MNSKVIFPIPNWLLGIVIAATLSLQGCGGRTKDEPLRAAATGEVLLNEMPLEHGVIRFIPQESTKGPQTSVPITFGRFEISKYLGPVVGSHRIEIDSTDDGGFAMDDETALQRLKESGVKEIKRVKVPAAYNSQSKLTGTITRDGPNEFQFELQTKSKR